MHNICALFVSIQAMAAPEDLLSLALNAGAVAPEGVVLLTMLGTLIVDLAGEKSAAKWSPPICYAGLGSALVLLAMQWNGPIEPSFLGSFLADNLAIALAPINSSESNNFKDLSFKPTNICDLLNHSKLLESGKLITKRSPLFNKLIQILILI